MPRTRHLSPVSRWQQQSHLYITLTLSWSNCQRILRKFLQYSEMAGHIFLVERKALIIHGRLCLKDLCKISLTVLSAECYTYLCTGKLCRLYCGSVCEARCVEIVGLLWELIRLCQEPDEVQIWISGWTQWEECRLACMVITNSEVSSHNVHCDPPAATHRGIGSLIAPGFRRVFWQGWSVKCCDIADHSSGVRCRYVTV